MYRIVIADDEPWILRGISQIIDWSAFDFEIVGLYDNPLELLNALEKDKPDVLITDIIMPELSGLQLISACKAKTNISKFVVISAYADFDYAKEAIVQNATAYLLKPFKVLEFKELAEKLKKDLDAEKNAEKRSHLIDALIGALTDFDEVPHSSFTYAEALENDVYALRIPNDKIKAFEKTFENSLLLRTFADRFILISPHEDLDVLQNSFSALVGIGARNKRADLLYGVKTAIKALDTIEFCSLSQKTFIYSDKEDSYSGEYCKRISRAIEEKDITKATAELSLFQAKAKKDLNIDNISFFYNAFVSMLINQSEKEWVCEMADMVTDSAQLCNRFSHIEHMFQSFEILLEAIICENNEPLRQTKDDINDLIRYIDTNFEKNLSLELLSKRFHISLSHLCRLFKKATGSTFTEYVMKKRIDKATELLTGTQLSITEICEITGYSDYFYFSRLFKKVTGVSPHKFRKTHI